MKIFLLLFLQRINIFIRYLKFLIYKINALIWFPININLSIKFWHKAVDIYICRLSILFHRHYDLSLTRLIVKLASKIHVPDHYKINVTPQKDKKKVLYFISNILDRGGHTRILCDLVTNHNNHIETYIYSNELFRSSKECIFYDLLKSHARDFHLCQINPANYQEKLFAILGYIKENQIDTIFCLENTQDYVAQIALIKIRENSNLKMFYYHHQNLSLSIPPDIFDLYFEQDEVLVPYAKKIYSNIEVLGIPIQPIKPEITGKNNNRPFTIFTATTFHKTFYDKSTFFLRFIVGLLNRFPSINYFLVIDKRPALINIIKKYFAKRKVLDRIIIKTNIYNLNSLYDEYDLYIDSLPVGGAKTLMEMMILGKPCLIYEGKGNLFPWHQTSSHINCFTFEELYKRIDELMNDREAYEKTGEWCQKLIKSNYEASKIILKLESFIDS